MKKTATQRSSRAIRICALPFAVLVAFTASAASSSWTQATDEIWNADINYSPLPSTEEAAAYCVITSTKPNSKNTEFTVSALEIPTYSGLITISGTHSLTLNKAGMYSGSETQDFAAKAILACSENQAKSVIAASRPFNAFGSKVNLNRIAANDLLSQVAIVTFDTEAKKTASASLTGRLSGATNAELTLAPIFSSGLRPLRNEGSSFKGSNSIGSLANRSSSNAGNSTGKTTRRPDVASFLHDNGDEFADNNIAFLGHSQNPEGGSTTQADVSVPSVSDPNNSVPNNNSYGETATSGNSGVIASLIAQNDLFKVAQTKAGINSELTNLGLPKQNSNNSSSLSAPTGSSLTAYNQGLIPTQITPNGSVNIFSSTTIAPHSPITSPAFSSMPTSGSNFSSATSSNGETVTSITIAANGTNIETKVSSTRTLAVKRAPSLAAPPLVVETDVKFNSDGAFLLDNLSNPLFAGGSGNGDGFAVELGYYDTASTSNNFAGNWVPMTGQNSLNTAFSTTSVGDGFGDPGELYATYIFRSSLPNTYMSLPPNTTIPLSLRFYNAVLISNATLYNAVSNDLWLWKTPGETSPIPPTIEMSLTQSNLEWAGGAPSAFKTTLAVPEPATAVLLAIGALGLIGRRHRRV